MSPLARECALLGADGTTIGDILTLPYLDHLQAGTAPKGPLERAVEKLLKTKKT